MFVTISNANITTIADPSLSDRHNDTSLPHSLTHKCQHFDYTPPGLQIWTFPGQTPQIWTFQTPFGRQILVWTFRRISTSGYW